MGINAQHMVLLKPYLKVESLLSLAYPDILLRAEEIKALFGIEPEVFTDNAGWHGMDFPLPETRELFGKLGIKNVRFVDVHASRGCEEIVDLNEPADLGKNDLVIDFGTSEHCFNVAQALKNAAEAVRVGGVIFHSVPMCMPNHGFWNYSPTTFSDFYEQNGWKVEFSVLTSRGKAWHAPRKTRFSVDGECALVFAARRMTDTPMKWPTQSKYLASPDLKAA
jgi:hypothetical protein